MTRRTRRTVFYALFGLFFVLGTGVVLYAQGLRLDPWTWHVEKVGAIYVRSFPASAEIMLDGKPTENKSGFLSRGTLISGLFPRSYALVLRAPGYADWHENATVLPSLVTEFKYAVLVPLAPTIVTTATVGNFLVTSGETVLETTDARITWRGKTVGRGTIVDGGANAQNVIVKTAAGTYVLHDLASGTATNLSTVFANNALGTGNVTDIMIDPYDAGKVVAENDTRAWIYNKEQGTVAVIERAPFGTSLGASVAITPSLIAWTRTKNASGTSAVTLYDKFSRTVTVSSSTVPGKTAVLRWIRNDLLGVLQADGSLYTYGTGPRQFQKLADDVKRFAAADDGSVIAALEHNSLEIFPLTDALTYRRFNLPDAANVQRLFWYKDASHLFIQYPDRVAFFDIEDLSLRNLTTVTEIATGTVPFYEPKENALYAITPEQTLVRFNFVK